MTQYLLTARAGGGVLWFYPQSKDQMIRKSSTVLAGLVFALGLIGFMYRLVMPQV